MVCRLISPPQAAVASASSDHVQDQGSAGQASPEMLPNGAKPAPMDVERRGSRTRIGAFARSVLGNHERHATEHEPGALELFARSLDVVQETITRLKIAAQPPDLLIQIPRNVHAFYEFDRAEELIEIGRQRTREALARWSPPRAVGRG